MTGDPDLTSRQVEVQQEIDGLAGQETADLMGYDFSSDINHLQKAVNTYSQTSAVIRAGLP